MADHKSTVIDMSAVAAASAMPRPQCLKTERVERPSSPEINCAICLEELRNKSFTNTCLHQFCFHCLLEWSKVKPECPLCKQGFSIIYHNIRPNDEYDEHVLEPPSLPPAQSIDPHIFINVAFQRHRFRYRSTMNGGSMMWAFQGFEPVWSPGREYPIVSSRVSSVLSVPPVRQGAATRSVTRSQQLRADMIASRRNVYQQGIWVRPDTAPRYRESSPDFYRANPAQTHRLVPWLVRELSVLLTPPRDPQLISQEIMNLISVHHINSSVFHRSMVYYLGTNTDHFIHEFYHFAISTYDMNAYDAIIQYTSVDRRDNPVSDSDSDVELLPEPLVSLDLSAAPGPSGLHQQALVPIVEAPLGSSARAGSPDTVIELSDDDDHRLNETDSDVEIIGQLPPRHLRTPEVITIESDSDVEFRAVGDPKPERSLPIPFDIMSISDDEGHPIISAPPPPLDPTQCHCPIWANCPNNSYNLSWRQSAAKLHRINSLPKRESGSIENCSTSPHSPGVFDSSSASSSSNSQSTSSISSSSEPAVRDVSLDKRGRPIKKQNKRKNSESSSRYGSSRDKRKRKDSSLVKRSKLKISSVSSCRYKESSRNSSSSRQITRRPSTYDSSPPSCLDETTSVSSATSASSSGSDKSQRSEGSGRLKSVVRKVGPPPKVSTSPSSTSSNDTLYLSNLVDRRSSRRLISSSETDE